jgi:putative membrane protein
MTELMVWYEWFRMAHILFFVSWMAGMFYLPRLFVYHATVSEGSEASETFKIMERKLLTIIMNPAMVATWLFGILMLLANPALLYEVWMLAKLVAVIALTAMHFIFAGWQKMFARDANKRSHRFYRIMNEVPTILMIIIVILAVIEPFSGIL